MPTLVERDHWFSRTKTTEMKPGDIKKITSLDPDDLFATVRTTINVDSEHTHIKEDRREFGLSSYYMTLTTIMKNATGQKELVSARNPLTGHRLKVILQQGKPQPQK